jgi:hypothetical protein
VVIDEVFANKFFPGVDPIGKRIRQDEDEPQTIVGVVGHVKQWGLDTDEGRSLRAELYEPFRQFSDNAMSGIAGGTAEARPLPAAPPIDENPSVLLSPTEAYPAVRAAPGPSIGSTDALYLSYTFDRCSCDPVHLRVHNARLRTPARPRASTQRGGERV